MKERILLKQKVQKSDLEKETEERGNYLLQRAYRMRLEQEDEIKDMEKMIVDARCHAVLDAQMIEKQQMEKELKQEELRLDQNMEVERQKVVRIQEELEEKRKQELIRGRHQFEKQIEEKEKERAIQAEMQDLEAQQIRDRLQQLHLEELRVWMAQAREGRGSSWPSPSVCIWPCPTCHTELHWPGCSRAGSPPQCSVGATQQGCPAHPGHSGSGRLKLGSALSGSGKLPRKKQQKWIHSGVSPWHLSQSLHLDPPQDLEKKQLKEREAHTEDFRINEQMLLYKEQKLEQERLADQRVLDYQKEKMAREADFEAQQEKARHEKELETARLRALQERAQDLQAEKDAVRAKRHQEAKE
ncbi:cilia- and flagella-associated protein 45 isoform X2 [Alligator mississippiensis]|uniref:cilia- and flagella-associated protein 45 isoform X2 n=1 Tax=Alligator mississippiensis TaxID=8496 RepID=UPI002877FE9C|nr:cilia- and flagella-associated protein 45 isoform X2 [Alligator mississippiensis]